MPPAPPASPAPPVPTPALDAAAPVLDLPPERVPRHVAIIMDGNGRWAERQGLPRLFGHHAGVQSVRTIVAEAARLRLEAVTLYSFSSENWKRPADEVEGLMALCQEQLVAQREELTRNGVRFRAIGRLHELPPAVREELALTEAATRSGTSTTLVLALNYGARAEIVDAVRAIARRVASGAVCPDAIDERLIDASLYTAGLPDPDLLIRTAGELRVSNYLLWQISYAELHVTDVLWPDFGVAAFHAAIRDFASRRRRFGGLDAPGSRSE